MIYFLIYLFIYLLLLLLLIPTIIIYIIITNTNKVAPSAARPLQTPRLWATLPAHALARGDRQRGAPLFLRTNGKCNDTAEYEYIKINKIKRCYSWHKMQGSVDSLEFGTVRGCDDGGGVWGDVRCGQIISSPRPRTLVNQHNYLSQLTANGDDERCYWRHRGHGHGFGERKKRASLDTFFLWFVGARFVRRRRRAHHSLQLIHPACFHLNPPRLWPLSSQWGASCQMMQKSNKPLLAVALVLALVLVAQAAPTCGCPPLSEPCDVCVCPSEVVRFCLFCFVLFCFFIFRERSNFFRRLLFF